MLYVTDWGSRRGEGLRGQEVMSRLFFGQSGRQMSAKRGNGAHSSRLSHDFGPEHLGTTDWILNKVSTFFKHSVFALCLYCLKNSVISIGICVGIVYLLFLYFCILTALAFHLQHASSLTGIHKAPRMRLANKPDPTFHSFADDIYIQGEKNNISVITCRHI